VLLDHRRIECPLGHPVYEAGPSAIISLLRVSPHDNRIAFIEHPALLALEGLAPSPGHVMVLDPRGQKVVSSRWASVGGLAWTPDGQEVWFTATNTGFASALQAMSLAGQERLVAEMGETVYLHDISREGRVLVAQGRVTAETRGRMALDKAERDYSWLDGTSRVRFSPDGRVFIFTEMGDGGGPDRRAYLRGADGSPAVWLGDGTALDVSPDGKWVVCMSQDGPSELRLVPTGAGEARRLRRGMIDGYLLEALFLPDGRGLVIRGSSAGRPMRLFVQSLPDGEPRPLTAEGIQDVTTISPDGRFVAARGADRFVLYPLDGGEARAIPGLVTGDVPLRFSTDGTALFVAESPSSVPSSHGVARLDLATGRKTPWVTLGPLDPTAMLPRGGYASWPSGGMDITPDGRSYLYSYSRFLSDLYIIDGLR
jgi:WD40 repeat protein